MKIVVTGTRGIPNIQGGVETHCEKLYPILAEKGIDITVVRRKNYVIPQNKFTVYKGVNLKDLYAPNSKNLEAIIHTFLSIIYAKKIKSEIIHIHNIGPAILIPLAKILGLKVVVTYHSQNYLHQKWGFIARLLIKLGEYLTANFSDYIIYISNNSKEFIQKKYKRNHNVKVIYNGVDIPIITNDTSYINSLGLNKNKYIVAIGRFVKDKGFHNLIIAYSKLKDKNYRLVIAGDADIEDEYSIYLKRLAKEHNVILTGFIKGDKLNELMSNAVLFVLPSFHEGLPIALLEAMSYNLDVLVSKIPANIEIGLESLDYFEPKDIDELTNKIDQKLQNINYKRYYDLSKYNWLSIANETYNVYQEMIARVN